MEMTQLCSFIYCGRTSFHAVLALPAQFYSFPRFLRDRACNTKNTRLYFRNTDVKL